MNEQENEILNSFKKLRSYLEKWGETVDQELIDLLKYDQDGGYLKIKPKYRVKDELSYLFKALYRGKKYENPINDIEDKVGTRVVLLKSDEIKEVRNLILDHDQWHAKITKDTYEDIKGKPDVFNYQSVHMVVWPNASFHNFNGDEKVFTCEIQIRTLLQHAFAEVSHDSTYKGPFKNDESIIRHLAKSMALMEATDDYFCEIFKVLSDEERFYSNYLNELIELYKSYNEYDKNKMDYEFNDELLKLQYMYKIEIQQVSSFLQKYHKEVMSAFKHGSSKIYSQPSILLALYCLYEKRGTLEKKWPLSTDILDTIKEDLGFATDL